MLLARVGAVRRALTPLALELLEARLLLLRAAEHTRSLQPATVSTHNARAGPAGGPRRTARAALAACSFSFRAASASSRAMRAKLSLFQMCQLVTPGRGSPWHGGISQGLPPPAGVGPSSAIPLLWQDVHGAADSGRRRGRSRPLLHALAPNRLVRVARPSLRIFTTLPPAPCH